MLASLMRAFTAVVFLTCILFSPRQPRLQLPKRIVLLEVIRSSWDADRRETLIYLRIYSDGFARRNL